MNVKAAHERVLKAQAGLAAAKAELEHAGNQLDASLAQVGWTRLGGAIDGRLYTHLGGNPVPLDQVLAHELRAAA
jgi:hypothetical protein